MNVRFFLNNIKEVIMLSASERLNSLRNLTQQLKTSTKKGPLDFSRLRQLVETAKQYRTSGSHLPPSPDKGLQADDGMSSESFRPLFPSSKREISVVSNQAQVLQLREQNLALENQIAKLKEQLNTLYLKQESGDKKQQEKHQFFKLSERLQCFVGRLQLKSQSYSGFQYSEYQVEVSLDKILLVRRQKGTVEQFELSSLKGGQYPSQNILVLRFEEFQGHLPCSIFIRFLSEQHLHKWDLALYSNYQIVTSLSQTKLFQRYFRGVNLDLQARREQQKLKALKQSNILDQQGDKDVLSLLIQKRQQYIEMKKLFSSRLDSKIKANLQLSKEEAQMGQYSLQEEKNKIPQFELSKEKMNIKQDVKPNQNDDKIAFQEKSNLQKIDQPLTMSKRDPKDSFTKVSNFSPIQRISQLQPIIQQSERNQNRQSMQVSGIQGGLNPTESFTRPINMQGLGSKVSTGSIKDRNPVGWQGNGSMRQSKASLVHQLNNIQGRNSSFQSIRNPSASKLRQIALQKYNTAKIRLQKGYAATKYSKDGFSPHEKHVFLSLDCKKLCWSQKQKQSQYKSIPIAVISKAEYGIIGQGIAKHLKNPDSSRFCVIEYLTSDYKKKTIELGSTSAQDIKDIVAQLNIILQGKQALATTS